MKGKPAEFFVNCLFILIFSYMLNFLWESFHAVALYSKHNFQSLRYVPMVSYVAIVDAFLILGIYLFVATLWRNLFWLKDMKKRQILASIVTGMALSGLIEYERVFVSKVWAYNQLMPTIFGIGVSPLLQLSSTAVIAFLLTRAILYQKGFFSN